MTDEDFTSRIKRLQQEQDRANTTTRRFLWADFLLVILVVAVALYLFWPLMFTGDEPYVPISTVNNTMRYMQNLKSKVNQFKPKIEGATFTEEAIQSIHNELSDRQTSGIRWALVDGEGSWKTSSRDVDFWQELPSEFFKKEPGMYHHSKEGRATLIFIDSLNESGMRLIVAKPFPPLFDRPAFSGN